MRMTWLDEQAARAVTWSAIAVGLLVGWMAKPAIALAEGHPLTWRSVVVDFLLMGVNAFIAASMAEAAHLSPNMTTVVTALIAISGDRAVRALMERFEARLRKPSDAEA